MDKRSMFNRVEVVSGVLYKVIAIIALFCLLLAFLFDTSAIDGAINDMKGNYSDLLNIFKVIHLVCDFFK